MVKKKMSLYGVVFLVCLFLIFTYFFSTNTVDYAKEEKITQTSEPDIVIEPPAQPIAGKQESNPETAIEIVDAEELDFFYDQIQTIINKASVDFSGDFAVTYIDLSTGKQLSVNGDKEFYTASTIKVPLAMMVADRVNEGVLHWNDKIVYNKERDYEEGTGKIINNIQPSYSLNTLQEYNITYSDNIAKNMLYSLFGGEKQAKRQLYRYFFSRETDVEDVQFTSEEAASILQILYQEKAENAEYQKIYDYMKKTVFHERLETSLTEGKVAHKIGSYDNYIHDIGILETSHPFILSVFTKEEVSGTGAEAISRLTDQLWKLQSEHYPSSAASPQQLIQQAGA
ncbi:serine hydrolase [Enterococcus sp. BWB1-3]|uniref:serine hydrolase n=1 Tax=Enterococcus sp. BWB1-3 TaxID=2787713 RepID=UPI001923F8B4|nr:serine hydrolase [Enterococcus sp. BWB1-3]MBL1229547.1 serine hydrolase [Enterococcus sp. BWB1-3]